MKSVQRFSPITIVLVMVIVQALESFLLIFSGSRMMAVFYLFLMNILITVGILLQARNYRLRRVEFIRKINDEAENSLNATLDNMPIGVIRYNKETYEPEWFNPFIDLIYHGDDRVLDKEEVKAIIQKYHEERNQFFTIEKKKYFITLDDEKNLIYLADATSEANSRESLQESRAVIGSISVDNYDDVTDLIADSERTKVNSLIASNLESFASKYGVYLRRVSSSRYYFFCDYGILNRMIEDKFSLLKDFRKNSAESKIPLTLSVGVSYGWNDFPSIGKTSLNNLELALVRGGDQAVLRENTPQAKTIYFGGNSESRTQKSRTRARAISTALQTIIIESEDVFIVGHRFPDMDALGAAITMKNFVNMSGKEAYVVYDPEQLMPEVSRAIDLVNETEEGFAHIIKLETAFDMKTENSLLIMVDHSKTTQTLSLDFYKSFSKLVVIDHHRRDDDFPEHALLSYIESSASSASELAVELLQFHEYNSKMTVTDASIALAGIELDTKHFTKATTSRTFEVAAYLRSQGADNNLIKGILATEFEKYKKINEIILNSEYVAPGVVVALGKPDQKYDNVATAKAADTLLDMADVQAAFSITNHQNGYISISARSFKDYNVQTIMEAMGGGGHFNAAATQIYERNIDEVKHDLIALIKERENEQ